MLYILKIITILLKYMSYLCSRYNKISTIKYVPLNTITYGPNQYYLNTFSNILRGSEPLYNLTPQIWLKSAHGPYSHVYEMQRIAETVAILANNRPFELHFYGRNINPLTWTSDYKKLLFSGFINGTDLTKLYSIFLMEYVKHPDKCRDTQDYINTMERINIDELK